MASIAVLVIGAPIVYLLSRALKLVAEPPAVTKKRKEAVLASLVYISAFVVVSAWQFFRRNVLLYPFPPPFDAVIVSFFAIFYAILLVPMILAMKSTGQNIGSIGINMKNKGRMLALGFILSVIFLAVSGFGAPSLGGGFAGFSSSLAYGFIAYAIVGFSEEAIFRGYIQTKLVAYGGPLKGLIVASFLFAFWHFPVVYFQFSGVILEALAGTLMRLAPSLLDGYMMLRSQNIIPSSIFHLFYDWSLLLWQIPAV